MEIERIMDRTPMPLDRELQSLLQQTTTRSGLAWKSMPSMAGYDTEVMAERWPSAMAFVPSRDGRSHTPAEFTPVDQLVPGVRGLAAALHTLAY
jgi:allantoate deiminase